MNKKYLFVIVLLGVLGVGATVSALDIQYPVKELGDCTSERSCKTYCDKPSNTDACLSFAEKHGLMSAREVETARKFLDLGRGPGGCRTRDECETYCDSIANINECVAFAEENEIIPPAELEEARRVRDAIARGVRAPACGGRRQCDAYCSDPANMEECMTFAREAGLMSPQELEDSGKVLAAIKAGAKPPPCKGKSECDAYCSQEEHFDVCLNFALAAGFMDPKDAEMAKKTKGKGPGGCRGKKECENFCQQEGNMEICTRFAYENGMMTKEEFEMAKKTGGKGPGGCKSKEECQNFCDNPANQETCFNFAKEHGMISEEELQRIEHGKQQFRESMQNIPPEVGSCLESSLGADMAAKLKSGEIMPPPSVGDAIRNCFEKYKPQGPPDGQMQGPEGAVPRSLPPDQMTGPGGCTSHEECRTYCESNPEQCRDFQPPPPQPIMQSGEPGPGPMTPFQPPPSGEPGFMMPPPCEGENCQMMPFQEPTGPTEPTGSIGPPAEFAPQPPPETAPSPPPPAEQLPAEPPPPTSVFHNLRNLLGTIVNVFGEMLFEIK